MTMQTQDEVGKYVTDGKMTYPYNAYLDDLIAGGKLQFCERPAGAKASPKPVYRSPINFTQEERLAIAQKLGVTLGDLTNMSPQEFEAALEGLENPASVQQAEQPASGFPT